MGTLYVVGTPIGNLEDITCRALRILNEVDFIIGEDTRVTLKLLNHYNIKKPLVSYHQHSQLKKIDDIVNRLKEQNGALVSDAGTPGISDPGNQLVEAVIKKGIEVIPIPGPSALTVLLSVAGLPTDKFEFLGFIPHKKGREKLFAQISQSEKTIVFYESPHRILKTLESLNKVLSQDRKIIVGRELTKMFEEIIRGKAEEVLKYFKDNEDKVRGEFVVVISKK